MEYKDIKWSFYRQTKTLISEQQLKFMILSQQMQQRCLDNIQVEQPKAPVLNYQIEKLLIFEFRKTTLLLVMYENYSIYVYEYDTGYFQKEFVFMD